MATKTSLLGLTKPAYTDAADITVLNTNFDLIDKAVGNRTRVPNLLANSWFVNPINYQGRTWTYDGVANYTTFVIDRWKTWSTVCSYTFDSNGIKITNNGTSSTGPYEVLQNSELMKGKTYTLAIGYGGGSVACGSVSIPSGTVTSDKYMSAANPSGNIPGVRAICYAKDQRIEFQIIVAAGQSVTVQWVALYEGAYDADTIPEYMVPDKRTEMVRCGVPTNPPNLLVNSWFVNPVNQRGQTVYTGSDFTIDFWRTWNAAATITLTSSGIKGDGTDASVLYQNLDGDKIKPNTAYTVAAGYSDGTIECQSGVITASSNVGIWNSESQVYLAYNNGVPFVRLWSKTKTIQWMAVYQGAYDADTLPDYVVPDKRAEMIRCGVPLNPRNLLDNSWFVNPVNHLGIASGATVGAYKDCIDRWENYTNTEGTLTFNNNGIVFQFNLCQFLNPDTIKAGMVVTAAAKWVDGTIQVAKGTITKNSGWSWFHSGNNNGRMIGVVDSNGTNYVRIDNDNGDTLVWAALYEGAYDVDTLPEYVVPNKRIEMTRCGVPLNPPNLLDNSYFRAGSAIAQAGVNGMHGSLKYPLDRWISWDKDITQSTNYITTGSPIDQYIESYKINPSAVYTAAVGFDNGTTQIVSGNFTTGFGSKATGCLYCATASSGKPYVRMQTGFNVCWVALYEGAYDADTLPEYHYKGYAAELAECQRYYENSWFGGTVASATRQFMGINISATQGDCYVQFMTPKAKVATITLYKASSTSTASVWEMYRSHYYEVTVESLGRDGRNGFVIRFTKTDADPTAWAAWEAVPLRGHWEASADL